MSHMEGVHHLKIPLEDIKAATNNFSDEKLVAKGGFGSVYKGELSRSGHSITVAVKRSDDLHGQGEKEFWKEITTLSYYRHANLVSFIGFCAESNEMLLVYKHETYGSLDRYITSTALSWMKRLQISIGAARGFKYLHDDVGLHHRVIHRDIKSSNILLNEEWEAKVSDFGLSKIGPSNLDYTFIPTNRCGTPGYLDPAYVDTGFLTKESDIYSFGVVLFELLCGRLAGPQKYEDGHFSLAELATRLYEQNKLDEIINLNLRKQMNLKSLDVFSAIAYQCLKNNRNERPTIGVVVEKLERALELQVYMKLAEMARVGTWGTASSGSPQNRWSFQLEKDHNLKMITIDHGDLIYSLMFTTECNGVLWTSNQAGGWNGGATVSKIVFDVGEEIISINGTVGTHSGYTIISSLSFVTNKRTHGPFGRTTENAFFVPWDEGLFGGFYGLAGYYIDCIGVYLKASSKEITQIGILGTESSEGPQKPWSFLLENNHKIKKITIEHGDHIYSIMFTTEYRGSLQTCDKVGGLADGNIVSEVTFDWDEEIVAISGTIVVLGGNNVISSLSFLTKKMIHGPQKTHGPFGQATGTSFVIPWDKGSFAGIYGVAGNHIDGIGIYLKATI